jgi:hypothetical protein
LKKQIDALSSEPTDNDLLRILTETESQNDRLREALEKNQNSGAPVIDRDEIKKMEVKLDFAKKEWRSRKRKFKEICDVFEENGALDNKKLKKLIDKLGIETDEQCGISINDSMSAQFHQTVKK